MPNIKNLVVVSVVVSLVIGLYILSVSAEGYGSDIQVNGQIVSINELKPVLGMNTLQVYKHNESVDVFIPQYLTVTYFSQNPSKTQPITEKFCFIFTRTKGTVYSFDNIDILILGIDTSSGLQNQNFRIF